MKSWLAKSGFLLVYVYNGRYGLPFMDSSRNRDDVYVGASNYKFDKEILPVVSLTVKGKKRGSWGGDTVGSISASKFAQTLESAVPEFFTKNKDGGKNDIKLVSYVAEGMTNTETDELNYTLSIPRSYLLTRNFSNEMYNGLIKGSDARFTQFIGWVS